ALRDLAVLLRRPAELAAEVTPRLRAQLGGQDESLVRRELSRERLDTSQVLAENDQPLKLGAAIYDRYLVGAGASKRHGSLESRLRRATAAQRTPPITHAGHEAQLEHVAEVRAVRKHASSPRVRNQLERRLAEAVLEVIATQPVAIRLKQKLTLCSGHQRDFLRRLAPLSFVDRGRAGTHASPFRITSGRHIG